ncbi:antiholin-like protein LrgB [Liquorilactobacillus mali]|nr:antiholin-like protein LrgB [Liquorilactobacillus mali]MDC7952454.1 antiholin-like protein LrgB [Liquorilactobacillus mali]MDV7757414.1 antiholin-like protein LrgB [Liquorilactobacillus mali]QFQ75771.1 antiholin-like protein LrgB [Liquorilactobacillus mali]
MTMFTNLFFGIFLSLFVYLIGQQLFKKFKGFFLFQPLFVAMVLGIFILFALSKFLNINIATFYQKAYKPGGDILFWFLSPATIAFAIPLYKRNDIVKKYWKDILAGLLIGTTLSLVLIIVFSKLIGLSHTSIASMLPQAATTAIALPISTAIGGNASITAMACILNAVIIYALGKYLFKIFHLGSEPIGAGLGLGTSGHTIGAAFALELGSVEGSMAAIAVVVIGAVVDLLVPIVSHIFL